MQTSLHLLPHSSMCRTYQALRKSVEATDIVQKFVLLLAKHVL
jgi:hypothetical protein